VSLRPLVASCTLSIAVLASIQPVEASAILFTDRAEFNAALNGEYQLFTDFPVTDFSLISALVAIGDYGGLRFAGDPFNTIQFGASLSSYPRPDRGGLLAPVALTQPVTAIGFDLVASNVYFPAGFGSFDFSSPNTTDALFSFETGNGLVVQTGLAPATFFGVLLRDDVFRSLGWATGAYPGCGFCAKSVSIDNLAVQSVPEPSSALLLFTGVSALLVARRRRASVRPASAIQG
jgi:hypothetical protein